MAVGRAAVYSVIGLGVLCFACTLVRRGPNHSHSAAYVAVKRLAQSCCPVFGFRSPSAQVALKYLRQERSTRGYTHAGTLNAAPHAAAKPKPLIPRIIWQVR